MMRINIGFSRKVGEANFSSRGGSVNLEVEVESGLVRDPDALQSKIDYLFDVAKASVDAQIAAERNGSSVPSMSNDTCRHNGTDNVNGHSNGNGSRRTSGRPATASQVRAICAIANRQRIDLATKLRQRFCVDRPDDLNIAEASELIDAIKPTTNGNGGQR